MKNLILCFLSFIAFIIVLGSIGAWDNGTIGFGQCLIQCAAGVGLAWLSLSNIDM